MTAAELRAKFIEALQEPLRLREGWDGRIDAAIAVVIEAALDAVDGDDGYAGECFDHAHAAIYKRIRALMPRGEDGTR